MRIILILAAATSAAFGQKVDMTVPNNIVDALERGTRLRLERERLELERQRQEHSRQMRAETERIQAEMDRLKAQTEAVKNAGVRPSEAAVVQREIEAAIVELMATYPDLARYDAGMARAMEVIGPAAGKQVNVKSYIESIYLVAKYAKFLNPDKGGVIATPDKTSPE